MLLKNAGNIDLEQKISKSLKRNSLTNILNGHSKIFMVSGLILGLGCDYCNQSSALSFEKIFSLEVVKNDISLGGASKQYALFSKNVPPPPQKKINK